MFVSTTKWCLSTGENKQIEVKRVDNDEVYREDYDVLVIATGSSPLKPPIPGIDADRIFPLWTIPDTDRVKAYLQTQQPKRAVVVGCGFIGLEMAENLHAAGCEVAMVEMADQVMPPLDFEMARILQTHLVEEGVALHLANGVSAFEQTEDAVTVVLADGKRVEADLAILAIGVRPNGKLAMEAGLSVNKRGGIVTDAYLKNIGSRYLCRGRCDRNNGFYLWRPHHDSPGRTRQQTG